jgi:hypothetical protein
MQSLRICISCMGFPMEILSLRWGNVSIDIRIGDNLTDVYLKEFIVIWEKQAHPLLVHLLVVDEDDVLDTAHGNPSPSPRQISSATGRLSERPGASHVQPGEGLQQGTNFSACSCLRKTMYTPQFLCRGEAGRNMCVPRKVRLATV